jgi:hypothetical protein
VKEWVGCLTLYPVSVYIQVWNEGLGNSEEGERETEQNGEHEKHRVKQTEFHGILRHSNPPIVFDVNLNIVCM